MAGEIAVTPEGLRLISAKMKSGAQEVEAVLSRLSSHVAPVRSEWTGPAQVYFNAFWDQSLHDANDLRAVLVGMATLTETAATAYETTDRRIAESFGEFRNSPVAIDTGGDTDDATSAPDGPILVDTASIQPASNLPEGEPEIEAEVVLGEFAEFEELFAEDATGSGIVIEETIADVEATETESPPIEDAVESVGASKTNGRLPWVRFISKSARSEVGDSVVRARVPERRFKTSDPALKPGTRLCRLCFTVVSLEPALIEKTTTHDYVRCPHCGNSFPVRHDDMAASS